MKTGKALSVITVLLIITVCTLTSFTGKNSKQELSVPNNHDTMARYGASKCDKCGSEL